jgi:predicted exporter
VDNPYSNLVVSAYNFWQKRRWLLFCFVILILSIAGLYVFNIPLSQDIKSMLPDKNKRFQEDFELFSYAPFARNILISLEVSDSPNQTSSPQESSADLLIQTADKITELLKPPYFVQVVSGITQSQKLTLFKWMYDNLPCLLAESDIERLREQISPAAINRQLQENVKILYSPDSVVLRDLILQDPLAFRNLLLDKLKLLSLVSNISADEDYFISKDHKHLLIIVETPIAITDFGSSRDMLNYLYKVLDEHTLPGIRYRVICGHRYTIANASTIQTDLWRVFIISITGLLFLFAIFLRTWRALYVFLIPLGALLIGISAAGCFFPKVSAITIGFGAVLLGISADFGLHVFYGFQEEHTDARRILAGLAKPLSFCALTTIGVFAVLLFSALPGQRQLAVFSIAGILAALLLALFVMPHLMPARPVVTLAKLSLPRTKTFWWLLWLLVILICVIPATRVKFDGNLRSIGIIPKNILQDEQIIKDTWGGVRDQAFVLCAADNPENALRKNDILFQHISKEMPDVRFLSLAPLIPSQLTQQENLSRWSAFWHDSGQKATLRAELERQGSQYGFNSSAFEPFLQWLDRPRSVFTPADFERECNDKLISPFVTELKNGQSAVLTFVPDDDLITASLDKMKLDVRVVSNRRFSEQLNRETVKDFIRFFIGAIVLVIVLLSALFLNTKKLMLAFLPVLSGIIIMLAIMTVCGIRFNIFNMVAAILVIGLGVDYGIFIVSTCEKTTNYAACNAVLVSGLTTFVGFGSLMAARHPAMNSIGMTVAAGIIPSLLCALTVLPSLTRSFLSGKKES